MSRAASDRVARDPEQAVLAGVCAGMAARYGIDVTLMRAIWVVGTVLTEGIGLVVYFVAALLMPSAGRLEARADGPAATASDAARGAAPIVGGAAGRRPPRTSRRVLAGVIWVFIALLLVQVYLAGLFLMGGVDAFAAHEGLGWSLTNYSFITLVVAAIARMPRSFWLSFAVFFVALHAQPFLTFASTDGGGWVRALHPMNAVLLAVLSYQQARMAMAPER